MHHASSNTPMASVLNLTDILQRIVNALNERWPPGGDSRSGCASALSNGTRVYAEWSDAQRTVMDGYVRGLTIPGRDGSVWVSEAGDVS
jgi:hypothetical protein